MKATDSAHEVPLRIGSTGAKLRVPISMLVGIELHPKRPGCLNGIPTHGLYMIHDNPI